MTGASDISVRPARVEDAEAVAILAVELRAHLGDPTHFMTPDVIRRDGFGSRPEFQLQIAAVDGVLAGYALFFDAYEPAYAARGFYLADLCVGAAHRRRGIGRLLVDAVSEAARARGRTFVLWQAAPENIGALQFYKSLNLDLIKPLVVHVRILDGTQIDPS